MKIISLIYKNLIGIILIALLLLGKYSEAKDRQNLKAEVIAEKDKILYYNEFNNNYLLDDDGTIYVFEDGELQYINEYEDIDEHEELRNYIEVK